MRLKSFRVQNYQSVLDTGIVELSENSNVSVFAGQNESGKSSILRALNAYEEQEFSSDSVPFSITEERKQEVSCTYSVGVDFDFFRALHDLVVSDFKLVLENGKFALDETKIKRIREFTITRKNTDEGVETNIDNNAFKIFHASILNKPVVEGEESEVPNKSIKYIELGEESSNSTLAELFWRLTPPIVIFDDFCDLLPDSIYVADLVNKKNDSKGYKAVRNLEKILNTDFSKKNSEIDAVRRTKETKENQELAVSFQSDWGQRVHGENEVIIRYQFEKREGEAGSYINFYIETKEGQPLPLRLRSKGLIWFLSLWLELNAQNRKNDSLILLLDEPDLHLHVKAQADVIKLINKLAAKNNQVIYSTHSPYLIEIEHLNRVKLIVNDQEKGTLIEDITTSRIDSDNKKDALQPVADAIGMNLSEFSPLSDKNVILEGMSDFYYFLAMKMLLKKEGDYSFIPGIGVRKINGLISLCIGYGLRWCAVIDDDPALGGKDTLNKFNEIKNHVFDGSEIETKKKIHILKNIVGIENMFTIEDLKLVDPKISQNTDKVLAVGSGRKVYFAKTFYEKVDKKQIKLSSLSKTAISNFEKAFNFIEASLK